MYKLLELKRIQAGHDLTELMQKVYDKFKNPDLSFFSDSEKIIIDFQQLIVKFG